MNNSWGYLLFQFLTKMMKANRVIQVALCICLLVGVILFLRSGLDQNVLVSAARLGTIRDSVVGNVKVYAKSTFNLRAMSQGLVTEVAIAPMGKPIQVEENQTLVKLQAEDLERAFFALELEKKHFSERNEVGSLAGMALHILEKELKSIEELVAAERQAAFDLEVKRSEVNRLRAQVEMEELNARHFLQNNQLKFANLSAEMTKRTISSPIDGEFSECFVSPGNIVMVGELVGVVHSNDRIIEVSLNEEDFVALEEGMAVAVNLFSMGEQVLFAKISSLSSSVEPQSGTRKLFVSMDDEANIPVGSSGKAEIILLEKNDALVLPTKALLGDSVLVVSSGVVEKRKVVTGAQNLKTVEIIEGIGVSEQVIVETPHLFQSGDRVNPTLLDFKD